MNDLLDRWVCIAFFLFCFAVNVFHVFDISIYLSMDGDVHEFFSIIYFFFYYKTRSIFVSTFYAFLPSFFVMSIVFFFYLHRPYSFVHFVLTTWYLNKKKYEKWDQSKKNRQTDRGRKPVFVCLVSSNSMKTSCLSATAAVAVIIFLEKKNLNIIRVCLKEKKTNSWNKMKFLSNKKKIKIKQISASFKNNNNNKNSKQLIDIYHQKRIEYQKSDFFLLIKINDNRLTNQTNGIMKKQRIFVLIETKNKKKFRFNFW